MCQPINCLKLAFPDSYANDEIRIEFRIDFFPDDHNFPQVDILGQLQLFLLRNRHELSCLLPNEQTELRDTNHDNYNCEKNMVTQIVLPINV